jgi:glycogen operon protein
MDWYDVDGATMSADDWQRADHRTLQYLAESTPETEDLNRVLLIVHGTESPATITLPLHEGVLRYDLLWSSADDLPATGIASSAPGETVEIEGASMRLYRAAS